MASEEAHCDTLIAQLYGENAIVRFSRRGARTDATPGTPDRLYFIRGVHLWYEVKTGRDILSPAQTAFLRRVQAHGGFVGVGGRDALSELVCHVLPKGVGILTEWGSRMIDEWQTRGGPKQRRSGAAPCSTTREDVS